MELLIVITIIGILISVAIMSQSEARKNARNTNVINQMNEYAKALELYHTDAGSYPGTNANRSARYCIGDNPVGSCLGGITTATANDNSAANVALRNYLTSLPRFQQPSGALSYSSPAYSGCTDTNPAVLYSAVTSSCSVNDYSFWFVLEGTNEECGRADVANSSLGGEYTLCRLQGQAVTNN